MQNLPEGVALTADAKIGAQKWQRHTTAADGSYPPLPLRPVKTLLPVGSGPLPTPHAVPHQSPPMQSSRGPGASSGGSSSSSSSDAGAPEASSGSSAVSYSHVTPYVATAVEDSSSTAAGVATPLMGDGGEAPLASSSPRQGRRSGAAPRRTPDQV